MRPLKIALLVCLLAGLLAAAGCSQQTDQTNVEGSPAEPVDLTSTSIPVAEHIPTPATALSQTSTPACTVRWGTTTQIEIPSKELNGKLRVTIYTPPCYDPDGDGEYPVLYLLHGQNMDDTFWPSIGMTTAADQVIDAGAPAFLMVFPYEKDDWTLPADSKFGDAILDDLIPYIENHYNVCTMRQCRAIGGLSRGGGWAIHLALEDLDEFGSLGAHSPGWFESDINKVGKLLKTHSAQDFPRIYMDRGDDDFLGKDIDLYEENLNESGIKNEYKVSPGTHSKAYWQLQVPNYINWYAQGFAGLK